MQNMYILGDVFLKNYYQVYNLENNTIGLGVNSKSPLSLLKDVPSSGSSGLPGSAVFFIIFLIFVVIAMGAGIGYYYYKRK